MPNLLLTQKCVRACPYCFAKKQMDSAPPEDILSWENMIYVADFVEASGENGISLLGGEPTLHPQFTEFVVYLLSRNFFVTVFTSGLMSPATLEHAASALRGAPEHHLNFVCNINDPRITAAGTGEQRLLAAFLEAFGRNTMPGFNIYHTDFCLDFLVSMINQYGMQRKIRLGLTHPIPGRNNRFIRTEEIDDVVNRLFDHQHLFERHRIKPGLDCGFPVCRFTDTQLGWFSRWTERPQIFACGPTIDIGPDLSVWSCFPLSSFHQKSLFEFHSLSDIHGFYHQLIQKIRVETGGIYEECDTCRFREERKCSGGCAAHLLSQFSQEAKIRMPEVYG